MVRTRQESVRSRITLAILTVAGLVVVGGFVYAGVQSRQTRECTIEAFLEVQRRRAVDHVRVRTAECGSIRAELGVRSELVNPDCPHDFARVGGRYRMTTVGFDFWPLEQFLVEPLEAIEQPPGTPCPSDGWMIGDPPVM